MRLSWVRRATADAVASGSKGPALLTSQAPPISSTEPGVYPITYVPPLPRTRFTFKRADRGLYDGKTRMSGNNVPESKHKTRRTWLPNVQKTKLYSEALDQTIPLKVTTSALRSIEERGGLDRYVLTSSPTKLGGLGLRLRSLVIAAVRERATLSHGFTRPILPEEQWRIPQYEAPGVRVERIQRAVAKERKAQRTLKALPHKQRAAALLAAEVAGSAQAVVDGGAQRRPRPTMVQSRHATEVEVRLVREGEEPIVDQAAGRARSGPRSTHPRRRQQ